MEVAYGCITRLVRHRVQHNPDKSPINWQGANFLIASKERLCNRHYAVEDSFLPCRWGTTDVDEDDDQRHRGQTASSTDNVSGMQGKVLIGVATLLWQLLVFGGSPTGRTDYLTADTGRPGHRPNGAIKLHGSIGGEGFYVAHPLY